MEQSLIWSDTRYRHLFWRRYNAHNAGTLCICEVQNVTKLPNYYVQYAFSSLTCPKTRFGLGSGPRWGSLLSLIALYPHNFLFPQPVVAPPTIDSSLPQVHFLEIKHCSVVYRRIDWGSNLSLGIFQPEQDYNPVLYWGTQMYNWLCLAMLRVLLFEPLKFSVCFTQDGNYIGKSRPTCLNLNSEVCLDIVNYMRKWRTLKRL